MNSLYDIIYTQFNDIDKNDYSIIGPQLQFLLKTVKNLYSTYKKLPTSDSVKKEVSNLINNYSALYELNDDLVRYRLNSDKISKNLSSAFQNASSAINIL